MKIKIKELNINGEGITNINQKKYCVKNVLPDEVVDIDVVKEKENFAEGKLKNIIESSPLRIKEKCNFCGKCGGCDFMFVNPQDALQIKKGIIQNYFEGMYDKEIITHNSKKSLGYRNKVAFFVKGEKIGLQERNSNNLIEVDSCIVAKEQINKVLNITREYLKESHEKNINHVVVRCLNNQVSITLVCKFTPKKLEYYAQSLKNEFKDAYSLYLNFNTQSKQIFSDKWKYISGKKALEDCFLDINYRVKPYSFMQINDDVRDEMYNYVKNEIKNEVVVEGYSGVGLLSCIMAKTAQKAFGVEINNSATQDANITKKLNEITNLENINGDCSIYLPKLISENKDATIVLDPPRNGCSKEVLDAIKTSSAQKIIYISCSIYTLKQNLVYLKDYYYIEKFEIFDIFTQTFDIESIVILKKK